MALPCRLCFLDHQCCRKHDLVCLSISKALFGEVFGKEQHPAAALGSPELLSCFSQQFLPSDERRAADAADIGCGFREDEKLLILGVSAANIFRVKRLSSLCEHVFGGDAYEFSPAFKHGECARGRFCFEHDTFAEIVAELKRYYNVDVRFMDDALRSERFSGDFRVEDGIYHIMSVLQLTYKFTYKVVGNDIEIYPNPKR